METAVVCSGRNVPHWSKGRWLATAVHSGRSGESNGYGANDAHALMGWPFGPWTPSAFSCAQKRWSSALSEAV